MENPVVTDMTTQTDLFLDRPDSPAFVAACQGIDAETQIWPGDVSSHYMLFFMRSKLIT